MEVKATTERQHAPLVKEYSKQCDQDSHAWLVGLTGEGHGNKVIQLKKQVK